MGLSPVLLLAGEAQGFQRAGAGVLEVLASLRRGRQKDDVVVRVGAENWPLGTM